MVASTSPECYASQILWPSNPCYPKLDGRWAPVLFLIACGAMIFDSFRFTIYLIQQPWLGIPAAGYAMLLIAVLYTMYRVAAWKFPALGAAK